MTSRRRPRECGGAFISKDIAMPRIEKPLGLNAVGKPFSPSYDPAYKMKYKPSYGHLRHPYGFSMRFVGDPPPKADNGRRPRRRQPPPAPLLDETSALRKQLLDAQDRLYQTQRQIVRKIDRAIKKADDLHQHLLALRNLESDERLIREGEAAVELFIEHTGSVS
jgi:hypothetical protein